MNAVASSFDTSDSLGSAFADVKTRPEESACVYFGPERLRRIRARVAIAAARGRHAGRSAARAGSLSAFVCAAVDAALAIDPRHAEKLEALAASRGLSVAALFREVVAGAVRTSGA